MPQLARRWLLPLITLAIVFGLPLLAGGGHGFDGEKIKTWMVIPFCGILLSIAVFPLVAPHFWHHHFGKVSAVWSVLGIGALFAGLSYQDPSKGAMDVVYEVMHILLLDYVPFIILLLGLFTIAGGIRIKGQLRGSPTLNSGMLLIGTVLASLMGTTGAAMLMIRPLIKANAWRKRKVHLVVFFIFLVCNIGGSLTPLGDPPLFLGFLKGVDFTWTTMNMWPETLFLTVLLIAVFYVFDMIMLKKEEQQSPPVEEGNTEKFGIEGGVNFALLGCLIGAILLGSTLAKGSFVDQDVVKKFEPQVAAATEIQKDMKAALNSFAEKKYADATSAYDRVIAGVAKQQPDHDGVADASLTAATAAPGEPAKGGAHDDHADHAHHDPYEITPEAAEKKGAPKEAAGGLAARRAAVTGVAAGTDPWKGKEAQVQSLILLDYQRSVMQANGIRAARDHDSTMGIHVIGLTVPYANLVRDVIILILALISWVITSKESRKLNGFSWFPILEVAKLFVGIFICIVPALKILSAGVNGEMAGVVEAVTTEVGTPKNEVYFWLTGMLSSFLDNAPTYLVFFNTAGGDPQYLMNEGAKTLLAISMGAVFMGANTYIGNAPNFMVKSIAEESDIKMPSFFGYMIWSIVFLIPAFYVCEHFVADL